MRRKNVSFAISSLFARRLFASRLTASRLTASRLTALGLIALSSLLASCQISLVPEDSDKQVDKQEIARNADKKSTEELTEESIDATLRAIIEQHQLTGDPSTNRDLPAIDSPLAQLGKQLFFTKALSGDMDVACVSCHHPLLGGGDDLALPIGIGAHNPDLLGPGRTHISGSPNVPRNAPTTFNIAMWDQVLFWDGRLESFGKTVGYNGADGTGIRTPDVAFGVVDPNAGDDLVMAQSRFPIIAQDEMRGNKSNFSGKNDHTRYSLALRLNALDQVMQKQKQIPHTPNDGWNHHFWQVFGEADKTGNYITETRIARALAAYERSQVFVDTPWKAYVGGNDAALNKSAKRGAQLFYSSIDAGGADCVSCHLGDFFTDEQFHLLAIPQIGPGKAEDVPSADSGRFRETGQREDLYAFRTPTLLNIEVTGPYGHSGAFSTVEQIIRHHLNPIESGNLYDMTQLDPAIQVEFAQSNTRAVMDQLEKNRAQGLPTITDVRLSDEDVADLVSFMNALTDPCVKDAACLAPWIANKDPNVLNDGQLLIANIPSLKNK